MKIKAFLNTFVWGAGIGAGVLGISYVILLWVGTAYASIINTDSLQDNRAKVMIAPAELSLKASETAKDQQLVQVIEELNRTKADLAETRAVLKSVTDKITEHFISNYRDTIDVLAAGLGILSAIFGGLIAWGYGLAKEGLTKKIKQETERMHSDLMEESQRILFYKVYANLSYAFYRYYRAILHDPGHSGFRGGVNLASWFARGARDNALKLAKGEKRDEMAREAALHLQYHLASESLIHESNIDKKKVIKTARELRGLLEEGVDEASPISFKETVAWVFILLGDETEKTEGYQLLKEVLSSPQMTVIYRKELAENYNKIGFNIDTLEHR